MLTGLRFGAVCQRHSRPGMRSASWYGQRFMSTPTATEYAQKHAKARGDPIPEDLAAQAPGLQTLAARMGLQDIPYSTLARTLITDTSGLRFAHNSGLAGFGKSLLAFYTYEHFMLNYPRLPQRVLRHAVDVYTAPRALAEIAKMWGVQTETRTPFARYLANVQDESVLGRLAYIDAVEAVEPGVQKIAAAKSATMHGDVALATFTRALIAAVYAHRGLDGARDFIYRYLIKPRKLDLQSVISISRPTRELAVLCAREGLEAPVSRLMAESGRFSSAPVYVVGVFSGQSKLGEGQGSSLKEARTRAAVNALQSWYLYSPVGQESSGPAKHVDSGEIVI